MKQIAIEVLALSSAAHAARIPNKALIKLLNISHKQFYDYLSGEASPPEHRKKSIIELTQKIKQAHAENRIPQEFNYSDAVYNALK